MDRYWLDNGRQIIGVFVGSTDILFSVSRVKDAVAKFAWKGCYSESLLKVYFSHVVKGYRLLVIGYGWLSNLVQRYDEQIVFCKFFRKKIQKNAAKYILVKKDPKWSKKYQCQIHRFTDSRICVGWKNIHNNIIILYIIYLLWRKWSLKILCECVNVWTILTQKFAYLRFFFSFARAIRCRKNPHSHIHRFTQKCG